MILTPDISIGAARRALETAFADRAGDEARLDARLLLQEAAGLTHAALIAREEAVLGDAAGRLTAMAARRIAGEPVSRILGRRAFWSMEFRVTPDTLDPRPDTETLIEAAAGLFAARRGEALRIADLGTGTGAILAALLAEFPNARGVGVDLSQAAAEVARDNLERLGLVSRGQILVGNWDDPLEGSFDLIASNPPYIRTCDIAGLAEEVRGHDPALALDGGESGLAAYQALAPRLAARLASGGLALLEVGDGQADAVAGLLAQAGLRPLAPWRDLGAVARVVPARRP